MEYQIFLTYVVVALIIAVIIHILFKALRGGCRETMGTAQLPKNYNRNVNKEYSFEYGPQDNVYPRNFGLNNDNDNKIDMSFKPGDCLLVVKCREFGGVLRN